jgi:hypothetical protein
VNIRAGLEQILDSSGRDLAPAHHDDLAASEIEQQRESGHRHIVAQGRAPAASTTRPTQGISQLFTPER